MKTIKSLSLILFALSFLLTGCMEEEPYADFTVSTSLIEPGGSVTFTNKSVNADSFEWFFGDGSSSSERNPTHIYNQMGVYIVTLIAYSPSGRKMDDAYHAYIVVVEPTELTFQVYMNGSPLANCGVVLFDNYNDWYNDVNSVASAYTSASGKVTFTGCSDIVYYADFYHNNNYYSTCITEELTLFQENIYNIYLSNKQVTFNNTTFTPIKINVSGFATRTIPVGSSTTYQVSSSSVSYSASTSEVYSNGDPLALTINWNNTLNLTTDIFTCNLVIGSAVSFVYFKNNSAYTLGPIYSNYGNSTYLVTVEASIPSDNVNYRIGYHYARNDTEFRAYASGTTGYYYWNQGVHYSFPFTDNQYVELWAGGKLGNFKEEVPLIHNVDEYKGLQPFEDTRVMFKPTDNTIFEKPSSFYFNK